MLIAVATACLLTPVQPVRRLLNFGAASSTEWQPPSSLPGFQPNMFVDITVQVAAQARGARGLLPRNALLASSPASRVAGLLARLRGAQVGVEAAEASCLLRQLG